MNKTGKNCESIATSAPFLHPRFPIWGSNGLATDFHRLFILLLHGGLLLGGGLLLLGGGLLLGLRYTLDCSSLG